MRLIHSCWQLCSDKVFCCFYAPMAEPRNAAALAFPASSPLSFVSDLVRETPCCVLVPSLWCVPYTADGVSRTCVV